MARKKLFMFLVFLLLINVVSGSDSDYSKGDFLIEGTNLYFDANRLFTETIQVNITVKEDYIYKTGYVLDVAHNLWNPFIFEENTIGNSDWIKDSATKRISLDRESLGLVKNTDVVSFVIVYACSKKDSVWDCHEGKWMAVPINATIVPSNCNKTNSNEFLYRCPKKIFANGKSHVITLISSADYSNKKSCEFYVDDSEEAIRAIINETKNINGVDILVKDTSLSPVSCIAETR